MKYHFIKVYDQLYKLKQSAFAITVTIVDWLKVSPRFIKHKANLSHYDIDINNRKLILFFESLNEQSFKMITAYIKSSKLFKDVFKDQFEHDLKNKNIILYYKNKSII